MLNKNGCASIILLLLILSATIFSLLFTQLTFTAYVILALLFGIVAINLFIEIIVLMIFRQPIRKKPSIELETWKELTTDCRGIEARALLNRKNDKSPLILIIHGWRSSAESVRDRAEWFCERGWHALIIEMPGHGEAMAVDKWTAIRVVEHTVELMDSLDEMLPQKEISNIVFYGHSMGGFVALNLSKRIDRYYWGSKVKGWILESPMTKYSMVYENSMRHFMVPKLLHTQIKNRLFAHFNELHPNEKPIKLLSQLDVPIWGLPKQPTLVIQAGEDKVLGRTHYELLVSSMKDTGLEENLTAHILEKMKHSGERINSARNELISKWLDELGIE